MKKSHEQGVLHSNDLYDLPSFLKSNELTDKLEKNWFNELKRCPNNPSLIRATLHTLGWKPLLNGLFTLLNVCRKYLQFILYVDFFFQGITQIIQPLLLTFLMSFFESCSTMPAWHAWLLALATILTAFSSSLISHQVIFSF